MGAHFRLQLPQAGFGRVHLQGSEAACGHTGVIQNVAAAGGTLLRRLTGQQRVHGLPGAAGRLVEEGLSVEVDALQVSGGAHVEQVPGHQLVPVHPQAFQVEYDAIDGCEGDTDMLIYRSDSFSVQGLKDTVNGLLQGNLRLWSSLGVIFLLCFFLCIISWFFS